MDAQVMKMTHELLGSMVQSMDNTEISDDEFIAAIVSYKKRTVQLMLVTNLFIHFRIDQLVATRIGTNWPKSQRNFRIQLRTHSHYWVLSMKKL